MNTVADATVPEKILLAAYQLEEVGQSPFSAEALIVASWQKFPKTFGLKGYAELYPDSNKVLSTIMGAKGLANRGWLVKMGQKLYALTRDGHQIVRNLQVGGEPAASAERHVKLTRDQEKLIMHLFGSEAFEKYGEDRKNELTFSDALRYWGISENIGGDSLDRRLRRLRDSLSDIGRLVAHARTELRNGRSFSADDNAQLKEVYEYLEEKFARHLNLLRTRSEGT